MERLVKNAHFLALGLGSGLVVCDFNLCYGDSDAGGPPTFLCETVPFIIIKELKYVLRRNLKEISKKFYVLVER